MRINRTKYPRFILIVGKETLKSLENIFFRVAKFHSFLESATAGAPPAATATVRAVRWPLPLPRRLAPLDRRRRC